MTLKRLLLAAGLALAVPAVMLTAPPAAATSIVNLSNEQLYDASTYVVRGVVTRLWTERDSDGRLWTRAEVQVDEQFKGPDKVRTLVVDTLGGRDEDGFVLVEGAARFSMGEELVLFAAEIRHGERLSPVAWQLGKYTIRRAPDDARPYVIRHTAIQTEAWDARFLSHPPAESRVYLEDLVSQIEARADVGWDGQPIPGISNAKLAEINVPERRLR